VGGLELVQTFQQIQQNHLVFRLLVMIDPIGQHSCISFFLCFNSLNPFFVIGFFNCVIIIMLLSTCILHLQGLASFVGIDICTSVYDIFTV